jgi:1,4-dihydroxy-2-naphthoyl-CoA synthase
MCNGLAGGIEMAFCSGGTLLMFSTEDFKEGFGSFLQKRKPQFKGR